jgi:hypothetical protein
MATPKEPEKTDIFIRHREFMQELDKESPVLRTRFRVSEIVPAHEDDDGRYVSPRTLNTWIFETRFQANDFIDSHEPEKFWGVSAKFYISEEYLREFHEKRWVSY